MLLGDIAQRVNADLAIDPATRAIIGNAAATAFMAPKPRDGWKV
jgi:hypothetical protein